MEGAHHNRSRKTTRPAGSVGDNGESQPGVSCRESAGVQKAGDPLICGLFPHSIVEEIQATSSWAKRKREKKGQMGRS